MIEKKSQKQILLFDNIKWSLEIFSNFVKQFFKRNFIPLLLILKNIYKILLILFKIL